MWLSNLYLVYHAHAHIPPCFVTLVQTFVPFQLVLWQPPSQSPS